VAYEERLSLLEVACTRPAPVGPVVEQVELLLSVWTGPDGPARTGWRDWKDLLTAQLPRDWHDSQVRAVAELGKDDPEVVSGVVDLLFSSVAETLERAINAARSLAQLIPDRLTSELTSRPPPSTASACSAVKRTVEVLGVTLLHDQRQALRDWLSQAVPVAPEHVLVALVNLDRDNTPARQQVLDRAQELTTRNAARVRRQVVHRIVAIAPAMVLLALRYELVRTADESQAIILRVEARLTPQDAGAREETTNAILRAGEATARSAATLLVKAADDANWWEPDYLAQLLGARSAHAAKVIAESLARGYREGRPMSPSVPTAALGRLADAEDQHLATSLVEVLKLSAVRGGLTPEVGESAAILLINRLAADQPADARSAEQATDSRVRLAAFSSLARDTAQLLGVLAAHNVAPNAVDLLLRYLAEVQLDRQPRVIKAMADALVSANRTDPRMLDAALAAWPTLPTQSQRAVAEALLVVERHQRGHRAEALLNRDDLPQAIRTYLLQGLRTES
jgi:hypothetical protein